MPRTASSSSSLSSSPLSPSSPSFSVDKQVYGTFSLSSADSPLSTTTMGIVLESNEQHPLMRTFGHASSSEVALHAHTNGSSGAEGVIVTTVIDASSDSDGNNDDANRVPSADDDGNGELTTSPPLLRTSAIGANALLYLASTSHMSKHTKMKKTLTWRQLIALGIGCTIGAGIFVVTGEVARLRTGPALFLSYIVSGFVCLLAAFCYAEFAAMAPCAGSAYTYARATMGQLMGWVIGWDLVLEYAVAAAAVANGWSSHLNELLALMGIPLPEVIRRAPWDYSGERGVYSTGAALDLPAIIIVAVITAILTRGIKESAMFNNIMVGVKVTVVLLVIFIGSAYINNSNYSPFMPFGFAGISFFGHTAVGQTNADGNPVGVLAGSSIVFFAYVGFDAVSCQAEECRNPQRDLPIGIIGSLVISTVLYVAVSLVLVGMVPYGEIDLGAPFSVAFGHHGLHWVEAIVTIGALAGITSVLLVTLLAQPRVLLAMSRDGLLPSSVFGKLHPVYRTPYRSSIVTGVAVAVMAGFLPRSVLVELVSIGTLLAFLLVCASVLVLRYTAPHLERPFRCPWVPFVPGLAILLCFMLMLSLPSENWYRLFVWLGIGLCIYFGWSKRNAALQERIALNSAEAGAAVAGQRLDRAGSNEYLGYSDYEDSLDSHGRVRPGARESVSDAMHAPPPPVLAVELYQPRPFSSGGGGGNRAMRAEPSASMSAAGVTTAFRHSVYEANEVTAGDEDFGPDDMTQRLRGGGGGGGTEAMLSSDDGPSVSYLQDTDSYSQIGLDLVHQTRP